MADHNDDQISTFEEYRYSLRALAWNFTYTLFGLVAVFTTVAAFIGLFAGIYRLEEFLFALFKAPAAYALFLNASLILYGSVEYLLHNRAIMGITWHRFLHPVRRPRQQRDEIEELKERIERLMERQAQVERFAELAERRLHPPDDRGEDNGDAQEQPPHP